jgi:hypothetical protein
MLLGHQASADQGETHALKLRDEKLCAIVLAAFSRITRGIGERMCNETRKRFFSESEAKIFARLPPTSFQQPGKRFLFLFSKKELLPSSNLTHFIRERI